METETAHNPRGREQQYREFVRHELLPSSVRLGAILFFVVSTVFVFVDWWLYQGYFWELLPSRVLMNLALIVIWLRTYRSHPLPSAFVICLGGGLMLLYVIHRTGGASSDYYVGLVLLLMGIGVVAPLTTRHASVVVGVLIAIQVVLNVAQVGNLDHNSGLQLFYLLAAGLIGIASCGLLDRMRFRDFCQRRELERARDELAKLDQQKSRFTANVHHELRTPLTLMLAPLDTLLGGDLGEVVPEQRQYLATIRENGLRLLKLINQLLDLARIESRQKELDRRPLDAGALARRILDSARPLAERKRVALADRVPDGLPVIRADADALEKVLVNLLSNALKFTECGGGIVLRGEATTEGVCFEVEDTGIGIPREQLGRVFDRFAQVDSSATRKHEGTGIGLALVKELVELHGGSVGAESDGVGHGSRFWVLLPLGEGDDEGEGDAANEEVVRDLRGRGVTLEDAFAAVGAEVGIHAGADALPPEADEDYRVVDLRRAVERAEAAEEDLSGTAQGLEDGPEVLVVEDNGDMRRLLAVILGREFRVRLAENGRRALEAVRERAPDLVLADVMMPEMSGLELCVALKEDDTTRAIPVVLITSKAEQEMKIEGLELGANDYVTKPFHPRELLARVRNLVRLRWLQAELTKRNEELVEALRELKEALRQLKETEAQLVKSARLAAVGELAAGVAHEVNSPVNFALNAVRLLERAVEDVRVVVERVAHIEAGDAAHLEAQFAEVRTLIEELDFAEQLDELDELVGIVSEGLGRTGRLVGNLRDFAAPGPCGRGSVDIRRGLESTAQLVRRAAADAGASIQLDLPPDLPQVYGDASALKQLFLNLLKNAVEAFELPGGTIRVAAEVEGPSLVLRFRDDGPGMEASLCARVFEPFFTTKPIGKGSGLGLSMCRRIVADHGGVLRVQSEPGEGSTFVVVLPLEDAASAKVLKASLPS